MNKYVYALLKNFLGRSEPNLVILLDKNRLIKPADLVEVGFIKDGEYYVISRKKAESVIQEYDYTRNLSNHFDAEFKLRQQQAQSRIEKK